MKRALLWGLAALVVGGLIFCGWSGKAWLVFLKDEETLEREGFERFLSEHRCRPGTGVYEDDHSWTCTDVEGCRVRQAFMFDTGRYRTCPSPDAEVPPRAQ